MQIINQDQVEYVVLLAVMLPPLQPNGVFSSLRLKSITIIYLNFSSRFFLISELKFEGHFERLTA